MTATWGDVTILIVEGDRTAAENARTDLDAPGRRLIIASDGTHAESILASEPIDLVILDLILPDRDGREFLIQLREQTSTSTIPVIALSTTAGRIASTECLAVGADDFIVKPADPQTLRWAVARQLEIGRRSQDVTRDGLTGLLNRAGVVIEFDAHRRVADREGTPLSLAVITLDCLAEVTMKLGRAAGDRLLLEICSAFHEAIGGGNRLGRWEISTLVAILPRRDLEYARLLLEGTILALKEGPALQDIRQAGVGITLNGGVTLVAPDQDLHSVISEAERSLYGSGVSREEAVRTDDDPVRAVLRRILLIETDEASATLMQHRLIRDGHEVIRCVDGLAALDRASEAPIDLILLGLKRAGTHGFDVLARIRDTSDLADVPVILVSGMGTEADVVRGLELGADDYLLKPFAPPELLARVRRHLRAGATAQSSHDARATP